jgi:hypothetical protein
MKKYSITQKLKTIGEIFIIRDEIFEEIPENILFAKSTEELCAYVLNKFDFPEGTISISDFLSIDQGCKVILELMGVEDDSEQSAFFEKEEEFINSLDRFMYYFLDFKNLPSKFKDELEFKVKEDLNTINNIIAEHEKVDFIRKGEKPRNHNQRTQHDFYKRCVEEKEKIEHHLLNGINERALSKARRDKLWGLAEMLCEEFRDRPYKLPMPKSAEYFSAEEIDKVGHRLGKISMKKGRELKQVYKKNKELFYAELEILIPEENILELMLQKINFLPFVSLQRKEIFKELIGLYKDKRWYGFYSLALTQIEGLFTEMCKICDPTCDNPYAALPDKVKAVRPYHLYSENKFDYFQYYLPNLRNRFLHFGIDTHEKIEILNKELLWDLAEVVSIFSQLNIDALGLLRLIRKKDDADFMSISGLCFYFKLLQGVRSKKQLCYFEEEIKNLNELYFPNIIFNIVFNLEKRIEDIIHVIYEPIKIQSNANGFEVDLNVISFQNIADNKDKISILLEEAFNWLFQSEIEELLQILDFIKTYKQYLDVKFIETDVQTQIEMLNNKYGEILKKISLIDLYIKQI